MNDKKKLIVIITAAVLILVGAIIGAFSLNKKPEPKTPATTKKEVEKKEATEYDNHVSRKKTTVNSVLYENDFSETLDPYLDDVWDKGSFYGCKAELTEDGWAHITSKEHIFVFGAHTWGMYGGIKFDTGKTYTMSFDLKKGSEDSNDIFTLNVAEEADDQDPRYGEQLKQLVLDFSNIEEMVTFNSNKGTFGAVKYAKSDGICHVEIRFTVDRGANNYLINSRDTTGENDWLIDNIYIAEITEEGSDFQWIVEDTKKTYDCSVNANRGGYSVRKVLLDEPFNTESSLKLENGGADVFFGPTKMVFDNQAARLTTGQHLFTFGRFDKWGRKYGGLEFLKKHQYVMSFDLKLGDARTQKVFNLYVMQEDDPDPRFGTALKTLKLDFNDLYHKQKSDSTDYFVKENTDNFASVVYNSETRIAHVEIRFSRDVEPDIQVVSKGTGDNEWVLDNFYVADITPPVNVTKYDYSNGISFGDYRARKVLFSNNFSESVDKGVTKSWHKSAFFGSKAVLDNGAARVTSEEHIFTYGTHSWALYGAVEFTKGVTYKMSFDLRLGDNNADRTFNLYVMTENGDPRFGDIKKTLTLDYMDYTNLVTANTDGFASVNYSTQSDWTHVEIIFTADSARNTNIVSKCRGENNWLIDNVKFEEVVYMCKQHTDGNRDGVCDRCGRKIVVEKNYSNGISFENYKVLNTLYDNDFSKSVNKGIVEVWEKSPFYGSTASLSNGWAHVTSDEHVFVFGGHSYGNYGGISMKKDTLYKASFDLKLGDEIATHTFNLYVMTENGDPRFGNVKKTLTLDFEDFTKFVKKNTDNFASVRYNASTHTAHIEVLFKTDSKAATQLAARNADVNNWFIDNLKIEQVKYSCATHTDKNGDGICDKCGDKITVEKDYDNNVSMDSYQQISELYNNDYSEDVNKGVDADWKKSAFFGSTVALEDGQARITSDEHVFVFGMHNWGQYGAVELAKDQLYMTSFDLKLGDKDANKIFNLYVTTENGDPRYGDAVKTLTLDFSDFDQFVTANTDDFAHVTYDAATHTAHIDAVFRTDASKNTLLVSRSEGANIWLLDNMVIRSVKETGVEQDYDNNISMDRYEAIEELYSNDYSEDADKGVDAAWKKSAFYGSTVALEDGQARITSDEHVFVFGMHSWGQYGAVELAKDQLYMTSFDLKLGDKDANKTFNLYVTTENGDPRYGDAVKTLTLDFSDFDQFVTANTDDFAHVTYDAATHTAHIDAVFKTDASKNTLLVSRSEGANNWLLDNMVIRTVKETGVEQNYDNNISMDRYEAIEELYSNDYSEDVNKGVDAAWKKSAFFGSTAALEDGQARITSNEHVFVFGMHGWGQYGAVELAKDKLYMTSFDLKLGAEDANKTFTLYVMTENGDPRYGDVVKTLTLNFEDFENFVTVNTDDFAHVKYDAATHTAHIDAVFKTDASKNTLLVSRSEGANNWLLDNMVIRTVKKTEVEQDYDNHISMDRYEATGELYSNDYSEDVNKGVDAAWKKSAFYGSTVSLEDGQAHITSDEHVFVFGMHSWGQYGAVELAKDQLYMTSFDLKLGAEDANKTFTLYVATENGDPRYGEVVKTLTLNFADFEDFVTVNTDDFAHVTYDAATHTAHIDAVFKTDASKNTLLVSRSTGTNNWLLDNMVINQVKESAVVKVMDASERLMRIGLN